MFNISINLFIEINFYHWWISWISQLSKWLYSLNFQYFECYNINYNISNNINYFIKKKKKIEYFRNGWDNDILSSKNQNSNYLKKYILNINVINW